MGKAKVTFPSGATYVRRTRTHYTYALVGFHAGAYYVESMHTSERAARRAKGSKRLSILPVEFTEGGKA